MLHRYILHNDQVREAADAVFSAGQVGLLSGWGVFSTLRVVDGVPFAFERHWARVTRDAAALHIPLPPDAEAVRRKVLELIEANRAQNSTLRLVVVRNGGGMWGGPYASGKPSDVIALTADSKKWGDGVKLRYVKQARHAANEFAGAKVLSWAQNLTWLEAAQEAGFDEVILLNERGEVAECTSANIFVANGNQVATPPLSAGCLPGITRELLLEVIRVPGIQIVEKTILPGDVEAADEAFITSTTRNLLPVLAVENQTVGRCQNVQPALEEAFGELIRRYVAEQKAVHATR